MGVDRPDRTYDDNTPWRRLITRHQYDHLPDLSPKNMFGNKQSATDEQWKNPGWLGYIGDEILPSYIGIVSYTMK